MSLITKEDVLSDLLNKVFDSRLQLLEKKSEEHMETFENCNLIIREIKKIDLNKEFHSLFPYNEEKRLPFSTRDNKNKLKFITPLRTLTNSATKDRIKFLDSSHRKEKSSKKLNMENKIKENELISTATKGRPKTQMKELHFQYLHSDIKDEIIETLPNEMKTCMTLKTLKGNKSKIVLIKV